RRCAFIAFDIGQYRVCNVGLRELRGTLVKGQNIDVAMLAECARFTRFVGIVPSAFFQHKDSRPYTVRDYGSREQLSAIIEYTHHVAILDSAFLRVVRMNPDWFASSNLIGFTQPGIVHL